MGVPFAGAVVQLMPQPRQSVTVLMGVSQPLSAAGATGRLQLPRPPPQADVHKPPPQLTTEVPTALQARLQAPQFSVLVLMLVSQPFWRLESQSLKPLLQLSVQLF